VFRLTSAGAIDTSFGTGGSTLLAYGGNWLEEPRQLLRDPAGGLYVGMQSGPAAGGGPVYWDALLVKLDPDGHVDPVFGIDGIARLSAVTGENLFVQGLAADAANRIYMLVYDLVYTPTSTSYYVVRFDAGGTRDASFGDAGRLALPPHPSTGFSGYRALGVDGGDNLLLQFDDSTYAAPFRTGLLRMSATGTLDQGFGTGGVLVDSSPGLNENWNPLRIDPQRGAVVAGTLDPPDHVTDLIAFRVPLGDFARIDLVSSAPVATKDASVNFTATPNLGGLTGAMEFRANGAVIAGCAAVALVESAATCQTGALPIGANLIVARYVNDPVKPDYHSPAIEQIVKPAGVVLDIDDDGVCDALTDGVLLARYLSGLRETGLVEGVLGTAASRSTGPAVADYLSTLGTLLDVDGDGQFDPLRDGLLVMRYLFGLRGPGLIADGIAPQGRRQSATDIETYLSHLVQ
jgi:hypothetical protein